MNLFESINNSLNNTVKNLSEEYLTEKKQKQEISPEDQKDNEIIRDVISELRRDRYYEPTDAEREVLRKHGIQQYDDVLSTYLGTFDAEENIVEHDYVTSAGGWQSKRRDPSKINFADMNRKQDEREKYYDHYFNIPGRLMISRPRVARGVKKQKGIKNNNVCDGPSNTQEIERDIENARLRAVNDKYKGLVRNKESELRYADSAYVSADSRRSEILDEINKLRAVLRGLDSKADALASEHVNKANEIQKEIDTHIDNKRKELQALKDRKRQQNESLLLEKKYIPTPEDKRDDSLLRSLLKKIRREAYDEITDEEKGAAERNKYKIVPSGLKLPDGSLVDADNNHYIPTPYHRTKNLKTDVFGYMYSGNVNLADLGRKRAERKDKFSHLPKHPMQHRGEKKRTDFGEENEYNFETIEQQIYNDKLKKDIDAYKEHTSKKNMYANSVDRDYTNAESDKEKILSQIKELKRRLSEIDNFYAEKVSRHIASSKEEGDKAKEVINRKKKEIEEKRKRREEKNNENK